MTDQEKCYETIGTLKKLSTTLRETRCDSIDNVQVLVDTQLQILQLLKDNVEILDDILTILE